MSLLDMVKGRLSLPVIGSPLFIISRPELVIAQCKAGIVGSCPALNARPASQLDEWLHEITEDAGRLEPRASGRPAAPFAINQIVHKSNDRLEHDLEMCVKYKVPIIITSLGARADVEPGDAQLRRHRAARHHQQQLRPQGDREGRRRPDRGGGRRGRPCRTSSRPFALVQEIREWFDGPLDPVGRHRHRPRRSGGAGDGRRPRLYRLRLHRHAGGQRAAEATSR